MGVPTLIKSPDTVLGRLCRIPFVGLYVLLVLLFGPPAACAVLTFALLPIVNPFVVFAIALWTWVEWMDHRGYGYATYLFLFFGPLISHRLNTFILGLGVLVVGLIR